MKRQAPEPLDIPWTCKSIESERSGFWILADGQVHCWIEYELIRGVTPAMLVWWFKHLEGDCLRSGQQINRYRPWHPRDHLAIEYSRRKRQEALVPVLGGGYAQLSARRIMGRVA